MYCILTVDESDKSLIVETNVVVMRKKRHQVPKKERKCCTEQLKCLEIELVDRSKKVLLYE